MSVLERQPAVSGDDGRWVSDFPLFDGSGNYTQIGKWPSYPSHAFIRFPNITIPPGAVITSAIVRFQSYDTQHTNTVIANLHFNNADNAVAPTTGEQFDALALTSAVNWPDLGMWDTGTNYDSPELKTILQAIIDRPGWASGNAVMLVAKTDPACSDFAYRNPKSYDNSPTNCAKLIITYSVPTNINVAPLEAATSGDAWLPATCWAEPFEAVGSGAFGVEIINPGHLTADLPLLEMAATGVSRSGILRKDLPALTLAATGLTGEVGRVNEMLPALELSASGLSGAVANLSALLPFFTIRATGIPGGNGILEAALPALIISAHGESAPAEIVFRVAAMNPTNFAVTEYQNFNFRSFAFFNGVLLGAAADGIYPLSGEKDNGANIAASFSLGKILIEFLRARDLYIVSPEEGMRRAKMPRGINPGYTKIDVENQEGAALDVDRIQLYGEPVRRKKH